MKKRIRERVLILIVSLSVLLSSTGAYSVFAQTIGASENGNTTVSSSESAATKNEQETTTAAQTNNKSNEKPNVVTEGGKVSAEILEGAGTAESPYRIGDVDDFLKMQSIINDTSKKNKYFVLTDDIDLSSIGNSAFKANKVLPGSLISVDKSLSDAAPNRAMFILDGKNHSIYGFSFENTGFYTASIFGYISANSVIKNVAFEDINVAVTSDKSVVNTAVAVYNNGEIKNCTFKNVNIDVKKSADNTNESAVFANSVKLDSVTGIVGFNSGSISDVKVISSKLAVAPKKVNTGLLTGENTGTIKNVYVSSSGINAAGAKETGFITGTNYGKIADATVKDSTASIGSGTIFGAVAGYSSGSVDSCVTSGLAEGSEIAGGIVGKADSGSGNSAASVTNCYTFFTTGGNGGYGAVVASGDVNYKNNYWSSELSGKTMAYENGDKDGDMVRAARLITVKSGATKTIEKSSFSARFGDAALVYDTNSPAYFSEGGVVLKENSTAIKAHAEKAQSYGIISYNLRTVVNRGFNSTAELTNSYKTTVLGISGAVNGTGLSEETALTIPSGADFAMVKYAPFASFKLTDDISLSSKWEAVDFNGTLDGAGHTLDTSTALFSTVTGTVRNITVVQNGQTASAGFGDAIGAKFENVKYLKGSSSNKDLFVGTVADENNIGSFINRSYGYTDIINCFTNVPIYANGTKLSNIGGLAGYLGGKGNNVVNSGASVYITGKEDAKLSNTAALFGSVSSNENGTIKNCYATLNSDLTGYAVVGGGKSDVQMSGCVYSSYNSKAAAAPKAFSGVKASEWRFDEGDSGFISGKGSVLTITLPKNIIDSASAEDFTASYDSNEINVNVSGITVKNGVVNLPISLAEGTATVKNSTAALIHKPTGLRASISLSNGLEKDKDGNYIIANGSDFAFISENIKDYGSASYVIARDIDMSSVEITPVGGAANAFSGTIEGNGHTIKGLNLSGTAKTALFGTLDGAVIRNIKFDSAVISATGSYAGVLAGQINNNSKISNISFTNCSVNTVENKAGILAGNVNDSAVESIKVEKSEVKALGYSGIVIGTVKNTTINGLDVIGCKAYGEGYTGAVAYAENVKISSASVTGSTIVSAKAAGGLVGAGTASSITASAVSGTTVKAENTDASVNCVAGAVAFRFDGTVTDTKVSGCKVSAKGNIAAAGGVVAYTEDITIKGVSVDSATSVAGNISGGFIGKAAGKAVVESSASYASVTGAQTDYNIILGSGGVIGRVETDNFADVRISKVNVSGKVYAYKFAGGLIGSVLSKEAQGVSVADCICANDVTTSKDGVSTSGKIIGFVKVLDDAAVESAVKNVIFSSYSSQVDAYGNIKAYKSYTDLDKTVKTTLNTKLSGNGETVVNIETDAAEYGFAYDKSAGWQSASSDKITVVSSTENEVTLKSADDADVAVAAEYKYTGDENIVLKLHFDAGSLNKVTLKGSGTKDDPYRISSKADFELATEFANSGAWFTLLNDIEFTPADFSFGGIFYNEGKGFTGLGTGEAPFNGTFLGNGHKISGLISKGNDEASLFGVTQNADISGLKVFNASVGAVKIAAVIASKAYDSTFTNISVNDSNIYAQGADSIAAAFAGFAKDSQFSRIAVKGCRITAESQTLAYSTSYAAGIVARDQGSVIYSAKVSADTAVASDGRAAGFVGLADGTSISDSSSFASVKGSTAAVIAANVKKSLAVEDVLAGGTVEAAEKAAGIAAEANGPISAENVTISADITAKVMAVAVASANKDVYKDSADSDVVFKNIVYSSYQIPAGTFGNKEINAYQDAKYLSGVVDVNTAKPVNGEFAAVGGESVKLADIVDFGKETQNYKLAGVTSSPEKLVKYNSADGTVTAAATNIDNAELVMVYDNGIKTAVRMISVAGMSGSGTKEDPYIISNADTMLLLRVYPQACFKMNSNVELKDKWIPVENFTGSFDGNGYTISGLEVQAENAGLFAAMSGEASFSNVKIKKASVKGTQNAGAVAAVMADSASVSNVDIIASDISAEKYAGAVVGSTDASDVVISNSKVSGGKVSAENAGGIAGAVSGTNTFRNTVVSAAEISGTENAGGITANADGKVTVDGAVSEADVKADFAEGGIIGVAGKDTSVVNSSALATLSGNAKHSAAIVGKFAQLPEDNEEFASRFANNNISGEYNEFEPAVMQYQNYSAADVKSKETQLKGKGTKEDPFLITGAADLAQIPDGAKGYYALANDIKLGAADYSFTVNADGTTVEGAFAKGYKPIRYFAGEFDGRGHIISGLYINSTSSYVGLFAQITSTGLVKNLHLEILSEEDGLGYYGITGNTYVGGIAGYCDASGGIENCTVKGNVTGIRAVGGLVGGLASSSIKDAVAVGTVTAQRVVGGAAGIVTGSSSIENSVVSCSVKSSGGSLVGTNNGSLELSDILVNGTSYGMGNIAVAENNGSINAQRMIISGANTDAKEGIMAADKASDVYSDITKLKATDKNIAALETDELTSEKQQGLESWKHTSGSYPVPAFEDKYSADLADEASKPITVVIKEENVGNVSVDYSLTNKTGDDIADRIRAGILIKSNVNGQTVTADFFTSSSSETKKIYKLLVTSGGFYVDSDLPEGYGIEVAAKDKDGKEITVTDAGSKGDYISLGANTSVSLEISIVKVEKPWGLTSVWKSLKK